jgi:hypothetical protein
MEVDALAAVDGHAQERSQSARTGVPVMTTELSWDWRE